MPGQIRQGIWINHSFILTVTASIIPRTSTRNPTHLPLFEQIINEIGNFLSICREDSSLLFMAGSFAICIAALFIPRSGMKDPEHKTRSLASPLDKIDSVPLCTKSSRLSHGTKSNRLSTHIASSFLVIFGRADWNMFFAICTVSFCSTIFLILVEDIVFRNSIF